MKTHRLLEKYVLVQELEKRREKKRKTGVRQVQRGQTTGKKMKLRHFIREILVNI